MEKEILMKKIAESLTDAIGFDFGRRQGDIDNFDDIDKRVSAVDPHSQIASGVSKMAILFDNQPFVIKIPFNGEYDEYDENESFVPFEYAGPDDESDYCHEEVRIYNLMKNSGFEMFFAEVGVSEYVVNGHSLYWQERVSPCDCGGFHSSIHISERSYSMVERIDTYGWIENEEWIAAAIECYGEALVEKFFNFLEQEHFTFAEDLHSGNYGYRKDGSPVILDFSGWNS